MKQVSLEVITLTIVLTCTLASIHAASRLKGASLAPAAPEDSKLSALAFRPSRAALEGNLAEVELKRRFLFEILDRDLAPLLARADSPDELYRRFLPPSFFSATVFFDVRKSEEHSRTALNNLVVDDIRGYYGGLILRGENLPPDYTGKFRLTRSDEPIQSTLENGDSLLGSPFSDTVPSASGHIGCFLMWASINFSDFAFDILALLNGTFRAGYVSSWHGNKWDRE